MPDIDTRISKKIISNFIIFEIVTPWFCILFSVICGTNTHSLTVICWCESDKRHYNQCLFMSSNNFFFSCIFCRLLLLLLSFYFFQSFFFLSLFPSLFVSVSFDSIVFLVEYFFIFEFLSFTLYYWIDRSNHFYDALAAHKFSRYFFPFHLIYTYNVFIRIHYCKHLQRQFFVLIYYKFFA